MLDVIEISIKEFKDKIYKEYIKLFPEDEQRSWNKVEKTYENGIEKFYKIVLDDTTIGFFMLEKINDDYPFYLDYFGIFESYQNSGYGARALQILIDKIILNKGLIGEVEKEDINNPITIRRMKFYQKNFNFKKVEREYLLYGVSYTPLVRINSNISVNDIDKIFFDYYKMNCGNDAVIKNCKIIKVL